MRETPTILIELGSGGFDDVETCELVQVRDWINEEIDRRAEKTMKDLTRTTDMAYPEWGKRSRTLGTCND